MNSVWVDHCNLPHFESLAGSIKTDVLIIGGGMAGVLCARFLHEKGVDYTLVEGRTIGSGITKDTTAKITAQHGLLYAKLLRTKGEETARKYLDAEKGGFSFRNYGNLLLLGGGSHRTGKTGGNWQQLYDFAGKHYPGAIPRYAWTPQLLSNGWTALTNLLTISKKRCPHLGCALKWNPVEHSWDCPCHGSRFEEDGTLIDNPANGDLPS